ncbi:glycoside hydrolase family 92 protein [Phyllobacterium sp. 628]|uniref:GH92 family glycosyl hydrolase n=1 Tax=Phyllobacterium sp. 628 TaxID=2718938 RepID=UPI0016621F8B|nr:GH92 family glycosyl hydrolase [Phyllobacterium sp. 628]QND51598.1 glycoside hydrolase family 92 protein [Phyllobacterium sp. 628]
MKHVLIPAVLSLAVLAGCRDDNKTASNKPASEATFDVAQQNPPANKPDEAAPPPVTPTDTKPPIPEWKKLDLTGYVDPLIGSDEVPPSDVPGSTEYLLGGFTAPTASVPFGMVAFGPDTPSLSTPWSPSGYHYPSKSITGFNLIRLSGVGCYSGGTVPFLPATDASQTSAVFDHGKDEIAKPGYYHVKFTDTNVETDLTATTRTGLAKFAYPAGSNALLKITAKTNSIGYGGNLQIDTATQTVSGSATGGGFCSNGQTYPVYFFAQFDQPFTGTASGASTTLTFAPAATAGSPTVVGVKVGVSYVSIDNAKDNLQKESSGLTFEQARKQADAAWNTRLNSIQVTGGSADDLKKFYTALYHSLIAPSVYSDANGDYMSFSSNSKKMTTEKGRTQYTTFSSWDTYRSLIPLQALLYPQEVSDMMQSLVNDAKQCGPNGKTGTFPMWVEGNTNSDIMPGDGASIIVAQSYAFGATAFDTAAARQIMLDSSSGTTTTCRNTTTLPGLAEYVSKGYLVQGWGKSTATSASTNMEYASTDFAISRFIAALASKDSQLVVGSEPEAATGLLKRSGNWANLFNPDWKNMAVQPAPQPQPRNADGTWQSYVFRKDQDTYFREGNAEQYTYLVPHDIRGLFRMLVKDKNASAGSEKDALDRLDAFTKPQCRRAEPLSMDRQ